MYITPFFLTVVSVFGRPVEDRRSGGDRMTLSQRRWTTLSLRTLLSLVTVLCVWLGLHVNRASVQRRAVERVEALGGSVYDDYQLDAQLRLLPNATSPGPGWLHSILGIDYFATVEAISLHRCSVRDLAFIASLTDLRSLQVTGPFLDELADLTPIRNLTKLEALYLSAPQLADISMISEMTLLEELLLENCRIRDLSPLADLTELTNLYLRGTNVSDVSPLSRLSRLKMLFLSDTKVEDVAPLSNLHQLRRLHLEGAQVADVSPLMGLTTLRRLELSQTQVKEEDASRLREVLPKCSIMTTGFSPLAHQP